MRVSLPDRTRSPIDRTHGCATWHTVARNAPRRPNEGGHRMAVEQHGARAALALAAAEARSLELEVVAQDVQQRRVGLRPDLAVAAVDPKRERLGHRVSAAERLDPGIHDGIRAPVATPQVRTRAGERRRERRAACLGAPPRRATPVRATTGRRKNPAWSRSAISPRTIWPISSIAADRVSAAGRARIRMRCRLASSMG